MKITVTTVLGTTVYDVRDAQDLIAMIQSIMDHERWQDNDWVDHYKK